MQNGELMGWVLMDELLLLLAAPPISLDILMPDVSLHLFSLNMYENSFVLVFIKSSSTVQQLCVMESERDTQREEEEGGRQFLQVLFFFSQVYHHFNVKWLKNQIMHACSAVKKFR